MSLIKFNAFESNLFETQLVDDPNTASILLTMSTSSDLSGHEYNEVMIDKALVLNLEQELIRKVTSELLMGHSQILDIGSIMKSESRESRLSEILDGESTPLKHPTKIFENFLLDEMIIDGKKSKFMVMNGVIGSIITDCVSFSRTPVGEFNKVSNSIYSHGLFNGSEIHIDPFMKWDDKRIVILNDNIKISISDPTFTESDNTKSVSIYYKIMLPDVKILEINDDISLVF